jgi:hypothetical protein
MASLTQISIYSRKAIRYGLYALIIIASARFVLTSIRTIYLRIFPPPPPKATVTFGKLPKIPFPEKAFPENLTYKIETPDGKLPDLGIQMLVYPMPPTPQNIQALEQAKTAVKNMGFDPNGKPILESAPSVYRFQKEKSPATLVMNIVTGVFSISYDITQDLTISQNTPLTPEDATSDIKQFLQSANLYPEDLSTGAITHQFYKLEGRKFVPVLSLSESNLIKVNLFRKNYGAENKYASVTPNMPQGNVWFLLSNQGSKNTIAAEYHYYPINSEKSSTYPIKTAQTAYDNLKDKKGYIVSLDGVDGAQITIRKIYLAYYDAGQYAQYYQPVVVFEGDDNFLAYVPAVTDDYYGGESILAN